ncbi:MAG: hypothetical protein OXE84_11330 [Rhodobacteraceae bacterium]|nr:hypothetical protein [Paracoccaceae bacterium]MCY4198168.1 hypothetical protein [Paracoccaceae bacterium]MCY4327243.1 hypothetical protein [Paracoccaceae bacterium]
MKTIKAEIQPGFEKLSKKRAQCDHAVFLAIACMIASTVLLWRAREFSIH